jgi:hypothetical protein
VSWRQSWQTRLQQDQREFLGNEWSLSDQSLPLGPESKEAKVVMQLQLVIL